MKRPLELEEDDPRRDTPVGKLLGVLKELMECLRGNSGVANLHHRGHTGLTGPRDMANDDQSDRRERYFNSYLSILLVFHKQQNLNDTKRFIDDVVTVSKYSFLAGYVYRLQEMLETNKTKITLKSLMREIEEDARQANLK